MGANQVIGFGDSGAYPVCFGGNLPYDRISTSGTVRAYWTMHGDTTDFMGHGSHLASLALETAPKAQIVMVDVERAGADSFKIPSSSVSQFKSEYFGLMYDSGARIACNAWTFPSASSTAEVLREAVDDFVHEHPTFLPVFASGNVPITDDRVLLPRLAPCDSLNVLCVGASYKSDGSYMSKPPMAFLSARISNWNVEVVPAFFGSTRPRRIPGKIACNPSFMAACRTSGAQCHLCVLNDGVFGSASGQLAAVGTACDANISDVKGKICLVARGVCSFISKARNCARKGASGVLIISDASMVMTHDLDTETDDVSIPVALIVGNYSNYAAMPSANVAFPLLDERIKQDAKTLYSRTSDILVTGDQLTACASSDGEPDTKSGTSQATAIASAMTAKLREFLQGIIPEVESHTLRAAIASAAIPQVGATFGTWKSLAFVARPLYVKQELPRLAHTVASYCFHVAEGGSVAVGYTSPSGRGPSLAVAVFDDDFDVQKPLSAESQTVKLYRHPLNDKTERYRVRVRTDFPVPYAVIAREAEFVPCTHRCVHGTMMGPSCECKGVFVGESCDTPFTPLFDGSQWKGKVGTHWLYFRLECTTNSMIFQSELEGRIQLDASARASTAFSPKTGEWQEEGITFKENNGKLTVNGGSVYVAARTGINADAKFTLKCVSNDVVGTVEEDENDDDTDKTVVIVVVCSAGALLIMLLLIYMCHHGTDAVTEPAARPPQPRRSVRRATSHEASSGSRTATAPRSSGTPCGSTPTGNSPPATETTRPTASPPQSKQRGSDGSGKSTRFSPPVQSNLAIKSRRGEAARPSAQRAGSGGKSEVDESGEAEDPRMQAARSARSSAPHSQDRGRRISIGTQLTGLRQASYRTRIQPAL